MLAYLVHTTQYWLAGFVGVGTGTSVSWERGP